MIYMLALVWPYRYYPSVSLFRWYYVGTDVVLELCNQQCASRWDKYFESGLGWSLIPSVGVQINSNSCSSTI